PGGAYRTTFLALDENEALSNMMTAIATLSKSELAGERVLVAWDNRDQEDEHSCFADNTHRDLRLNFLGIKEVYLGKNGAKIGPSIHDLVEQTDANLATEIITALDNAEDKVENTAIPFDYAISNDGERPKVRDAVTALQDLGDKFVTGGTAIGVTVGSELPE
ncbi:MAG: imelysin family protein, partial [Bacteroidota bacterium]